MHVMRNEGPPLIGRNALNFLNLGISEITSKDNKDILNSQKNVCHLLKKFKAKYKW